MRKHVAKLVGVRPNDILDEGDQRVVDKEAGGDVPKKRMKNRLGGVRILLNP